MLQLTAPDGFTVRDPDADEVRRRLAASRQPGGQDGMAFGLCTGLMVLATCVQLAIFRRRRWI